MRKWFQHVRKRKWYLHISKRWVLGQCGAPIVAKTEPEILFEDGLLRRLPLFIDQPPPNIFNWHCSLLHFRHEKYLVNMNCFSLSIGFL